MPQGRPGLAVFSTFASWAWAGHFVLHLIPTIAILHAHQRPQAVDQPDKGPEPLVLWNKTNLSLYKLIISEDLIEWKKTDKHNYTCCTITMPAKWLLLQFNHFVHSHCPISSFPHPFLLTKTHRFWFYSLDCNLLMSVFFILKLCQIWSVTAYPMGPQVSFLFPNCFNCSSVPAFN